MSITTFGFLPAKTLPLPAKNFPFPAKTLLSLPSFTLFQSSKPFSTISISSYSQFNKSQLKASNQENQQETKQSLEQLPKNLQEIVNLFHSVDNPKAKYAQLLGYAKTLSPLEEKFKTSENKVQGCVSQVWVRAYLKDSNREDDCEKVVMFEADSDSVLTKGLAALLVKGLSGETVKRVVGVRPEFFKLLGLNQSLTPSRNNGFFNMLKLMQLKAVQLVMGGDGEELTVSKEESLSLNGVERVGLETMSVDETTTLRLGSENGVERVVFEDVSESREEEVVVAELGSRGERIREVLERELRPVQLEVEDISYQHAGHAGVRGSGDGETHFNVRVVSEEFEGKSMVKRHRVIYKLLNEELQSGLHALSIVAKTPSEV